MEQITKTIIGLFLAFSITTNAQAGANQPCDQVDPVKKGDVIKCDGFYFPPDVEKQAEQYRADADFYKKLSTAQGTKTDILEDENSVLQKRLNLYVQESKDLSKEKAKSETTETLIRIGYFSLGVLVTALVARNVRQ